MSGIGGIMDIENYCVDIERLNKMRLALSLRGRRRSTAFLLGSVGIFFNSSSPYAFSDREDRQPNIAQRRGHTYALCIDGEGFTSSSVLEKYMLRGIEFIGALDGPFALSLYDGERNMLILARDRKGRKPLFYQYDGNNILFCSEVKGIVGASEGYICIDRDILSCHITSPMGVYRASDLYTDIREVLPGECILFTRMGMSRFFYRDVRGAGAIKAKHTAKDNTILSPYFGGGRACDTLSEALIAFDYPQFDAYMPSLCGLLGEAVRKGKRGIYFEDFVKRKNLSYSYEREDRFGNFYGVSCIGILPRQDEPDLGDALLSMKKELFERFYDLPQTAKSFLSGVMGESRYERVCRVIEERSNKKEDTEDIRILGMLLQAVDWAEANRLVIKSESKAVCYDYI